jgi:ubiquinol-cytochrome c reductase cytochrome c subunit
MRLAGILLAAVCAAQSVDTGKKAFDARCVGCHGSDGTGGGHGPGILEVRRSRATSKQATRDLILKGIPEAGMPAFPMPDARSTPSSPYVAMLKAPAADNPVAGDVAAGERVFKAQCSSCHMVNGQGDILGPIFRICRRSESLRRSKRRSPIPPVRAPSPCS